MPVVFFFLGIRSTTVFPFYLNIYLIIYFYLIIIYYKT